MESAIFQRLLTTVSLSGSQWVVVIALSLVSPLFVAIDKVVQLRRVESWQRLRPGSDRGSVFTCSYPGCRAMRGRSPEDVRLYDG